ncbi:MAG: SUMF1/EgtB/PvdO family nonheme iron enzyme [Saprospiraceae bacterium]
MKRLSLLIAFFFLFQFLFSQTAFRTGKDYAVFFAVSDFEPGWNALPETIIEVKSIKQELEQEYGFTCDLVLNPTKSTIQNKIRYYNNLVREDDQIMFFFSMHGYFDKRSERGYLIGKDGKSKDEYGDSWLSYADLANDLSRNKAKHILLALDACHSGSFGIRSKGGRPRSMLDEKPDCKATFNLAMKNQSRQFCASGNKDAKTPAKSKFAKRFLKTLQSTNPNEALIFDQLASELLGIIRKPRPVTGSFSGHEDGLGFVFIRKNSCQEDSEILDSEDVFYNNVKKENTLEGYMAYLEAYKETGKYIKEATAEKNWLVVKKSNNCTTYRIYLRTHNLHREEIEKKCGNIDSRSNSNHGFLDKISNNMIMVKGGTFIMGNENGEDDEMPLNQVTLSSFYLSKYEVTQTDWKNVMGELPRNLGNKGCEECPVENISWEDARRFINKLNNQSDKVYRLPTEAEWEYAALQGQNLGTNNFDSTPDINLSAWYYSNSNGKTHPVGQKNPNRLGIYDMSGNVYEWCQDWYGRYTPTVKTNPTGPSYSNSRVCRGGSWGDGAMFVLPTNRGSSSPKSRKTTIGLRLARSVK